MLWWATSYDESGNGCYTTKLVNETINKIVRFSLLQMRDAHETWCPPVPPLSVRKLKTKVQIGRTNSPILVSNYLIPTHCILPPRHKKSLILLNPSHPPTNTGVAFSKTRVWMSSDGSQSLYVCQSIPHSQGIKSQGHLK